MPSLAYREPGPQPFLIEGSAGPLFAVYHPPADGARPRAVVLFAPPFAEEMNRSRRMATLAAQALAARGIGMLAIDPWGTGDSGGEFAEATWEQWRRDVEAAIDWLRAAGGPEVALLGLRLGAALAVEAAAARPADVSRLVLWQPVVAGKPFLNAFLRIRLAAGLTGAGTGETTATLRAALETGETVEVAGYALSPALAGAIDALDLAVMPAPRVAVDWLEVVAAADRPVPPASRRVVERWRDAGARVHLETVPGEPFWSYQETTIVPALIERTTQILAAPAPEAALNAPPVGP